jgi:hypothetical protein
MSVTSLQRDWHARFSNETLDVVRTAIPKAIHLAQERAARAHVAWGDADGDQSAYGVMSRGVQKELRTLLTELPAFREVPIEKSARTLTYLDDTLLFPWRVGKTMPRNHTRIRVSYLSERRRELFHKTGTSQYDEPGLFETQELTEGDRKADGQETSLADVFTALEESSPRAALIVPYYSSTPSGVGRIYWAPAKLVGNYLEFARPESLTFVQPATETPSSRPPLKQAGGFASGERPRTATRLRNSPKKDGTGRE